MIAQRSHLHFTTIISLFALISLSLTACLDLPQVRNFEEDQRPLAPLKDQGPSLEDLSIGEEMMVFDRGGSPMRDMIPRDAAVDNTEDMQPDHSIDRGAPAPLDMGLDQSLDMEVNSEECVGDTPSCEPNQGVCAGRLKTCYEGSWVTCLPQDFGEDYEQSETRCDCLDNDCDGFVDEDGFGHYLSCPFDQFKIGPTSQCVLRESSEATPGVYRFQSLRLTEGVALSISPDSSAGFPSNQPCLSPRYEGGGGLYIYAQDISLERGSIIDASAPDSSTCSRNSSTVGVYGASGGDIHLYARSVSLGGSLIAHGGAGTSWSNMTGGAAGSIQLYAEQIDILESGELSAIGGLPSNGSVAGPGSGFDNTAAAASGPMGQANENRSIRLVGQLNLPQVDQELISSQTGDEDCVGLVDLWGEAIITSRGICGSITDQANQLIGSLALHLELMTGSPEGLEVSVNTSAGDEWQCTLHTSGWCLIRASFEVNDTLTLSIVGEAPLGVDLSSGALFLSYGHLTESVQLIGESSWIDEQIRSGLPVTLQPR